MKANLIQKEPATLKQWQQDQLYEKVRRARTGSPHYVFHDGPPYANGAIHLGHLLNKVLKDFVVRSKTMSGFDCPYVPGWDCHGLPIEHMVLQESLGEMAKVPNRQPQVSSAPSAHLDSADASRRAVRRRCQSAAKKFVRLQSQQMQRLLTLADYEHPYLTMEPTYEAAVLEVFAGLVGKELVYRDLKPVYWSIANQTALAEAELEYEQRQDTSVYALFEVDDHTALPASMNAPQGEPVHLMIWTTTPWTLPANLATAVHERYEYGLYRLVCAGKPCLAIIACDLARHVLNMGGVKPSEPLGTAPGTKLSDLTYRHPFISHSRPLPVVHASYVTLEDGTGLVHTAPGHGVEDYLTGIKEGLEIYCPVKPDGTFDHSVPSWLVGVEVWKANELVLDRLRSGGQLFHEHLFEHSYPHDWRSKTPVIFRATEQWFVRVDGRVHAGSENKGGNAMSLRDMAMAATHSQVEFIPEWGRNRMRGMLESRPDWCLSRQRAWGLPIPAFFDADGERYLLTAASIRAVAAKVRQKGSDYWFAAEPADLLNDYDPYTDPDAPDWIKIDPSPTDGSQFSTLHKSADIFDVWFESGSSWNAVIRARFGDDSYPTDLYLEGSDQHRGWFQLSLLPALGVTGRPPFRNVLTHGFMVDKDGRKMSKSGDNAVAVEDLLKDFGADVCRWWVASLNTDNDIKVDAEFFKLAGEEYRKVRNTIRFLLGNLDDYDNAQHRVSFSDANAGSIDAWALGELEQLVKKVRGGYDRLDFRSAYEAIFKFCNETMSSVYLAALKDRLYCDRPDSPRRRRSQTAMYDIAGALVRLMATILPHTAEESWSALHGGQTESVHLELLPERREVQVDEHWGTMFAARDQWLKVIEDARQELNIDNPLDCGLQVPAFEGKLTQLDPVDLADLCGISRLEIADVDKAQVLDLRSEPRCERSWKRDGTVRLRNDGGMLSDRDADAAGV